MGNEELSKMVKYTPEVIRFVKPYNLLVSCRGANDTGDDTERKILYDKYAHLIRPINH